MGGTDEPAPPALTGLPCDVAQALSNCQACHGDPLAGGAPLAMMTLADLTATSTEDSTQTVAQRAVMRMSATDFPMPPLPQDAAPQSDIDTIQAWIDAGYPGGTCTPDAGGTNPFDTPANATCTISKGTTQHSPDMRPGEACMKANCHLNEFTVGGTIFPTPHEKDDCNGGSTSGHPSVVTAKIIITDSKNKTLTITGNPTDKNSFLDALGNFASVTPITPPYTVKLQYTDNGKLLERDMTGLVTPPTDGDCNSCHTESGDKGAPGRILLP